MANPKVKKLTKDVWNKAFTIPQWQDTVVDVMKPGIRYLQTYRNTGDAAPKSKKEGVGFINKLFIYPDNTIDLYIMPLGSDGRVRISSEDIY